jgi:hypothetical protein
VGVRRRHALGLTEVGLLAVAVATLLALSLAACHSPGSATEEEPATEGRAAPADAGVPATSPAAIDLAVLIKQLAEPYPDGDPRYASSNPYDYTQDNPAFAAVVAMGYDALAGLEADLTAGGLGNYLDCIAIETITCCDLKQFPQFTWGDALTFATQWDSYLRQMPLLVTAAFGLSSYYPPRPLGIERLGAPAVPFIIDEAAKAGVGNESQVVATLASMMTGSVPAGTIAEFAQVNRGAIEKLRAYVENR